MTRRTPAESTETAFDLVVVGAGVNGAGIARDAALRGLRVLLLDKGDLCGGTSALSTRLIHGGLRYLEHGELRLVRESLRERETLLRVAPHLVRPLPLLLPVYEGARRGPLTLLAGMVAYDILSAGKTLDAHRMFSPAETLRRAPGLGRKGLRGAFLYFDAQVAFPERLVVENALDARANGAALVTHARVRRVLVEGGRAAGVEFTDLLTGEARCVRGRVVVNAAGPWVDEVLRGAARGGEDAAEDGAEGAAAPLVGGTKGSHVVVADFDGAPRCALYAEARRDGRPFFVIPWDGRLLVGTTDTRYDGDLDAVAADEAEIAYLLEEANRLLPSARLTRASVLYTYAGVRPLAYARTHSEAAITRRHFLRDHGPDVRGLLSVVGGKLTTYRSLSELAVDEVFRQLGRRPPPCRTASEPLPGSAARGGGQFAEFAASFAADASLGVALRRRLLNVYGVRAADVLRLARDEAGLLEPLTPSGDALAAEVVHAFRHEAAETLGDCLLRRTMTGLNDSAGLDHVEAAAAVARRHLGWDAQRAAREVSAYRDHAKRMRTAAPWAQAHSPP